MAIWAERAKIAYRIKFICLLRLREWAGVMNMNKPFPDLSITFGK